MKMFHGWFHVFYMFTELYFLLVMWRSEDNCRSLFSPPCGDNSGVRDWRHLGLATGFFTHWAILPAPFALFKEFIEVLLTLSTVSFLGATFNFSANSVSLHFSSYMVLIQLHYTLMRPLLCVWSSWEMSCSMWLEGVHVNIGSHVRNLLVQIMRILLTRRKGCCCTFGDRVNMHITR